MSKYRVEVTEDSAHNVIYDFVVGRALPYQRAHGRASEGPAVMSWQFEVECQENDMLALDALLEKHRRHSKIELMD